MQISKRADLREVITFIVKELKVHKKSLFEGEDGQMFIGLGHIFYSEPCCWSGVQKVYAPSNRGGVEPGCAGFICQSIFIRAVSIICKCISSSVLGVMDMRFSRKNTLKYSLLHDIFDFFCLDTILPQEPKVLYEQRRFFSAELKFSFVPEIKK